MPIGGKTLNWILEIISIIFQTVYQFFDKILKSIWESLPTFMELKQMLGSIPPRGVYAIMAGALFGLLRFVLKGIWKMRKKKAASK